MDKTSIERLEDEYNQINQIGVKKVLKEPIKRNDTIKKMEAELNEI